MSVEDVLDWIDRRFVCGCLTVERGSVVRTFHFDSGYVTGASSNDPSEHLGQLLMNRGMITEETLTEAFKVQADTGVLLGKILLMIGAVDETDLRAVLEEKIREAIYDAMSWAEGSFRFERAPEADAVSEFEISVNLRSTVEDGRTRVTEWQQLREVLPSDDVVLYLQDAERLVQPSDTDERSEEIKRLAALIERNLTVNQIVLEENGRRFQVVKRLVQLVDRGALALDRRAEKREAEGAPQSASDLERAARGRAARGDRAGALEMARSALELSPESSSLQKLHRELERSVFAELSRDLLANFCVPRLLKSKSELDALEMTDSERYLAGRIDGHWDLLSLMRVSPLREVEALITFKRLADRGIISL
jgi:hypothetical protein